jgi:hypothetical protein
MQAKYVAVVLGGMVLFGQVIEVWGQENSDLPNLFQSVADEVLAKYGGDRAADLGQPPTIDDLLTPRGIRARIVQLDFSVLDNADVGPNGIGTTLNLFPDTSYVARLRPVEAPSPNSTGWVGRIEGTDLSVVSLVKRAGAVITGDLIRRESVLAGNIRTATALYEIRPIQGDNSYVIREMDQSKVPECALGPEQEIEVPDGPAADIPDGQQAVFDVLVLYTGEARSGAGGTTNMNALVDLAVIETNHAYLESSVQAQVRLVHSQEVSYEEAGSTFSTMLDRLKTKSDGYLEVAHTLRDQHQADLVVLIVENDDFGGLAYRMKNNSSAFSDFAFSVVSRVAATGNYSFGHELAHNMGCCHDRDNAGGDCLASYAYGWRFNASGIEYRTVMSYPPGLRIPRFSNPGVMYDGVATGTNDANNARTINQTRGTVQGFR